MDWTDTVIREYTNEIQDYLEKLSEIHGTDTGLYCLLLFFDLVHEKSGQWPPYWLLRSMILGIHYSYC